ncbi:MAG: hypothetical protein ABI600_07750 [Luteolibacter sp.]
MAEALSLQDVFTSIYVARFDSFQTYLIQLERIRGPGGPCAQGIEAEVIPSGVILEAFDQLRANAMQLTFDPCRTVRA